ncbi:isoaspartyl peptidase/L-asparaginase [Corallococcus sp. M34]|nr:isoaspartyl peptidase/L-asparaginase [Citreicoccus inhibens]MBU8899054.1 isoaspartyl peptidase/L-asparaginase [Citreicoccus inhibens]
MLASLSSGSWSHLVAASLVMLTWGCAASTRSVSAKRDEAMMHEEAAPRPKPKWGLVIHGGAGVISRENLSPEREAAVRAALAQSLQAGHAVLARGGSSLDAVSAAIHVMEDSPYFNAGKGAVFNHDGVNELDAAIMDGRTRAAGAVAGVRHIRNPIDLARMVMEKSPHVMMVGDGAEAFARSQGMEWVDPKYFYTEERWQSLQRALEKERETQPSAPASSLTPGLDPVTGDHKFGTVGAVALDASGNLAAGTSTGGMTNKRFGRVGDSPVIGAGTYADPRCAVSATGHGEFFIRYTVARDICARVEYQGLPLAEAAHVVVNDVLVKAGGEGGVIAMDHQGNVTMPFNSSGMYRGVIGEDGVPHVAIFQE